MYIYIGVGWSFDCTARNKKLNRTEQDTALCVRVCLYLRDVELYREACIFEHVRPFLCLPLHPVTGMNKRICAVCMCIVRERERETNGCVLEAGESSPRCVWYVRVCVHSRSIWAKRAKAFEASQWALLSGRETKASNYKSCWPICLLAWSESL